MKDETKVYHDAILVTDKVLAASLCAIAHEVHNIFEYSAGSGRSRFYAVFKITKRLREDLKLYYGTGLCINAKVLSQELDDIDEALADYINSIEHDMRKRSEAYS